MKTCETCGNQYDKCFEIVQGGTSHYFDCFECAIHSLAPTCNHCNCRIIGHGLEGLESFTAAIIVRNRVALPTWSIEYKTSA